MVMPLTAEDKDELDLVLGENPKLNLDRASHFDPEKQAEVINLSESRKVPMDTVERNLPELQRRERVESINTDGYPKLTNYLNDEKNSRVSIDDTDSLKGLEDAIARNRIPEKTWGGFTRDLVVDVNNMFYNMAQMTAGAFALSPFDQVNPILDALGFDPERMIEETEKLFTPARRAEAADIEATKGFFKTVGKYAEHPAVALGTFVQSGGMMAAGVGATKAVATSLLKEAGIKLGSQEAVKFLTQKHIMSKLLLVSAGSEGIQTSGLMQRQALEAGRTWAQATPYSILAGIGTTAISFFGGKLLPDAEAMLATGAKIGENLTGSGKRIALSTVKEGILEEMPQSMQEQIFSNLAMDKPWDEGVMKAGAEGIVVGSLAGTSMSTVGEIAGIPSVIENASIRKTDNIIRSSIEQGTIDSIIEFSQSSKTRGRTSERFKNFVNSLDPEQQIFIGNESIVNALEAGIELPLYITEQLDGLGTDIAISAAQFANDIAANEELMPLIRPHIRINDESLTQAEIDESDDLSIKTLLEKAEKSQETRTEAEQIFDEVKEQLVATGRQGELTARYSATVIPAYATVKAEQTGKSVKEIYEMMGLTVVGPEAPIKKDGVVLGEKKPATETGVSYEQDFGDITFKDERVLSTTGKSVTIEQPAQRIWDRNIKRRDQLSKLKDCINA